MDLRCLESWYGSYLLCVSLKQKQLELAFYCLIEWVVFYEYWGNSYLEMEFILQVMFPSTLLGTGENWTLMKTISVTEYLNYEAG